MSRVPVKYGHLTVRLPEHSHGYRLLFTGVSVASPQPSSNACLTNGAGRSTPNNGLLVFFYFTHAPDPPCACLSHYIVSETMVTERCTLQKFVRFHEDFLKQMEFLQIFAQVKLMKHRRPEVALVTTISFCCDFVFSLSLPQSTCSSSSL